MAKGAHRHTDDRACGALTIVIGQSTVYVNNLWWAVEGDIDTHCDPKGPLKAIYGAMNIYIENKKIIVGENADHFSAIDYQPPLCTVPHAPKPSGHSPDTFAYE